MRYFLLISRSPFDSNAMKSRNIRISFSLSPSLSLSLIPSDESQISLVLVTRRGEGEQRSSSFQHQSSIIHEKHKFLAWIQAKTIHQSINPQSWVELVGEEGENIRAPILWFESSFSVSKKLQKKKRKRNKKFRFQFNELTKRNEEQNGLCGSPLYRENV